MTPKTTAQNIAYWIGALALTTVLALLTGIATHWPEGGSIDWRGVWLDVIQVLLSTLPVVAAGLGLPRLGREQIARTVSDIGPKRAQAVLQDVVYRNRNQP